MLDTITNLVGAENIHTDKASLAGAVCWPQFDDHPPLMRTPLALASPPTPESMSRLIAFCNEAKICALIRGGATTPNIRINTGSQFIVVSTKAFGRIEDIDQENQLINVQAGVTARSLKERLKENNLFLPALSHARPLATIGGLVAANEISPGAFKYGALTNFIVSLEIILATGERISTFNQNGSPYGIAPGLPLASLFCGSRGILGVIDKLCMRLLPLPACHQYLLAEFNNLEAGAQAAKTLLHLRPDIIELLGTTDMEKCKILLEFAGTESEVETNRAQCQTILKQNGVKSLKNLDESEYTQIMRQQQEFLPFLFTRGKFLLESIIIPPNFIPDFLKTFKTLCEENDCNFGIFGQLGVARLNIALFYEDNAVKTQALARELFTIELILNKQLHSERDSTLTREQWQRQSSSLTQLSANIKKLFDPHGILLGNCQSNGGKRYGEWIEH